jgi:hypothetical protein
MHGIENWEGDFPIKIWMAHREAGTLDQRAAEGLMLTQQVFQFVINGVTGFASIPKAAIGETGIRPFNEEGKQNFDSATAFLAKLLIYNGVDYKWQ